MSNNIQLNRAQWASRLNISQHAMDLYLSSDIVDLHIDSFIWTRLLGYKLQQRHGPGILAARYFRQVDIPRIREARIAGATWVITTNPLRGKKERARAFAQNLRKLSTILESQTHAVRVVRTFSDYEEARQANLHAAFLAIQGGNAIEDRDSWDLLDDGRVLRVTLVHLTNSALGCTSSPLNFRVDRGLTALGHEFIECLDSKHILIDLAHASPRTFWEVLDFHDKSLPILVSHTGIDAIHHHWRNLTDRQLSAVADTGGLVGVFFHGPFLGRAILGGRVDRIAKHIAHAVQLIGAQHVAIGSDWDGMIATPLDMPTCLELPRLVQALLNERLADADIRMVLGASFLRLLRAVRPG
jgi:membrane dipeptidase